jgi:hypothetical protein
MTGKELLAPNMRLTNLSVQQFTGGINNLYTISAGVAYGDNALLCDQAAAPNPTAAGGCDQSAPDLPAGFDWMTSGATIACKNGASSQFCAYSRLTTQVTARFEASGA